MSENDTKLSQSFTGWRGLITLISLLLSVPGLIKLGSYPWLASKHRVKATDLVLETLRQSSVIDTTRQARFAEHLLIMISIDIESNLKAWICLNLTELRLSKNQMVYFYKN
jgi:hypothetical protein